MIVNKNTAHVRFIDALGRIVLPKEVRTSMNWNANSALEVWVNEAGNEVILKTHTRACTYCGATENLKEFRKHCICSACQNAISNL